MKVYISTDFPGKYTQTAAIIVANTEEEAKELLMKEAEIYGLEFSLDQFTVRRVSAGKPYVEILSDGDY